MNADAPTPTPEQLCEQLEAQVVAFTHAADRLHNAVVSDRPLLAVSCVRVARAELAEVERLLREYAAAQKAAA